MTPWQNSPNTLTPSNLDAFPISLGKHPDRDVFISHRPKFQKTSRSGRIISAKDFGNTVLAARKKAKLTQAQLAAASGLGERFVRELEKGKVTCQLDKSLLVAQMLGIKLEAHLPPAVEE
jgi:y4mF family transcriptional regulator